MIPTGRRRRILAALVGIALVASTVLVDAAPVAAAGGSGASSRVVGRGDIVTSIIGWRLGGSTRRVRGTPTRCRWILLNDAEIEWLAAVAALRSQDGEQSAVLDAVRHLLVGDEVPDGDLQARVCNRIAVDLRYVPLTAQRDSVQILHRRMITRLPVPDPVWSPPGAAAVPLHQPVFVSIPTADWVPIENTITVDGLTAQVRAEPVGLRVISGDPAGDGFTHCTGPARPYDRDSSRSVREQAALPDTCTITYRTASTRSGGAPNSGAPVSRSPLPEVVRPGAWIGTVTVLWRTEWRTGDGPWTPLGVIPRTRLFDRSAREVHTSIESHR